MSPTHQDLSNDTTFSQIKSRVPVPLTSHLIFYSLIRKDVKGLGTGKCLGFLMNLTNENAIFQGFRKKTNSFQLQITQIPSVGTASVFTFVNFQNTMCGISRARVRELVRELNGESCFQKYTQVPDSSTLS